jgi:hypothetical protein
VWRRAGLRLALRRGQRLAYCPHHYSAATLRPSRRELLARVSVHACHQEFALVRRSLMCRTVSGIQRTRWKLVLRATRCVEMVASGLGYDGGQSNACHAFSEVANAHSAQFSSRYCAQCLAIGTLRSTLYNFGGCIATCVALATEQGYIFMSGAERRSLLQGYVCRALPGGKAA